LKRMLMLTAAGMALVTSGTVAYLLPDIHACSADRTIIVINQAHGIQEFYCKPKDPTAPWGYSELIASASLLTVDRRLPLRAAIFGGGFTLALIIAAIGSRASERSTSRRAQGHRPSS
jgi:hypothetical protein